MNFVERRKLTGIEGRLKFGGIDTKFCMNPILL